MHPLAPLNENGMHGGPRDADAIGSVVSSMHGTLLGCLPQRVAEWTLVAIDS
jgi:hypothetical protein